ncbi:hypothetical protein pb186bvf_011787 [Paramecium bursaria]
MKYIFIAILLIGAMADPETEAQNAEILELLNELRQQSVDELNNLEARFQPIRAAKKATIQEIQQGKSYQNSECYNRQQDVDAKLLETDIANEQKAWYSERQQANQERLSVLSANICDNSNNYIDNIKNARILLSIIQYLKRALQNYDTHETSLAQVDNAHVIKQLTSIINIYKDQKNNKKTFLQAFAQLFQENGELTGTIDQLIALLDSFQQEVENDIANGQTGQVNVGTTFSEFKYRIEKENEVFTKSIYNQEALIEHFQRQLVTLKSRVDKCQSRLAEISQTLLIAEEDLGYAEAFLLEDKQSVQDEIDLFDWLIRHYKGETQPEDISIDGGATGGLITGGGDDDDWYNDANKAGTSTTGSKNKKIIDYTANTGDLDGKGEAESGTIQPTTEATDAAAAGKKKKKVIDYTPLEEKSGAFTEAAFAELRKRKHIKTKDIKRKHH